MDIKWDDRRTRQFVTNIGLTTSNGQWGHNVMATEWTHHVSYEPSYIMINVHDWDATVDNIKETGEFGVSLAAENQNIACSVAGGSSGKIIDKIAALKELGIEFYNAHKIDALMIKGAVMNAECTVVKHEKVGDHIMFIGEVVDLAADENIKPLIYHNGKYCKIGENVHKPSPDVLENIKKIVEKHKKQV